MLKSYFKKEYTEAGCDEAGRGCLAGPVFAAAVILPVNFKNPELNDSKKLTENKRFKLREVIEKEAIAFGVAMLDNHAIDEINILNASIKSMHLALDQIKHPFNFILVDGNRFKPYQEIEHKCVIKGDATYLSIAAASVLAKTYRDEFMEKIHQEFPEFKWNENKGYPTEFHRKLLIEKGHTPYHRKSFNLKELQLKLDF